MAPVATPKATEKLLDRYAAAAGEAEASHRPVTMQVTVDPDGSVHISDGAPDDPLAAARARGRHVVARLSSDPEMLNSDAIAVRMGITRETVRQKRKRGELLGVGGNKRGLRYPAWQLDPETGIPYANLPRLISGCDGDHWRALRLLQRYHPELGRTGLDALRAGDIEGLLRVSNAVAEGAFA